MGQELRRRPGQRLRLAGARPGPSGLQADVPTNSRILDAGAGTGLVGKILAEAGHRNLTAIDMSPGCWKKLAPRVCIETCAAWYWEKNWTPGRFIRRRSQHRSVDPRTRPASSLDEMVRVTRPGGFVIFTLRPDLYESAGFREVRENWKPQTGGSWRSWESRSRRSPRASRKCITSYGSSEPPPRVEAETAIAHYGLVGKAR